MRDTLLTLQRYVLACFDIWTARLKQSKPNEEETNLFFHCVTVGKVSMTHHSEVSEDTAGKWTDADYIAR